jgi:hypothetical protein
MNIPPNLPPPMEPSTPSNYHVPAELVEATPVALCHYGGTNEEEEKAPKTVTIPSHSVFLEQSSGRDEDQVHYYHYDSYNAVSTAAASQSTNPAILVHHDHEVPVRRFRGRIVKAKNAHLPDRVLAFKKARQARTAASAWAGGIIGFATFGPPGAVVGAFAAYGIAKAVGKYREHKLIQRTGTLPARVATAAYPQMTSLPAVSPAIRQS